MKQSKQKEKEKSVSLKRKRSKRRQITSPILKSTFQQYSGSLGSKQQFRLHSLNLVSQFNQQHENMRLFKKLNQIKKRKNNFQNSREQLVHDRVTAMSMATKKVQRQLKVKALIEINSRIVDRIDRIRSQNSTIFSDKINPQLSRLRKRSTKSVLLPSLSLVKIEPV